MASTRIFGILASEAQQVVLFRRGPARLTLQLVWDLKTDEITPGQWVSGRLYTQHCDVSPDGRYLISNLLNPKPSSFNNRGKEYWGEALWTAISRPPYFTALAISFGTSYDQHGGVWKSNREARVGLRLTPKGSTPLPVRTLPLHGRSVHHQLLEKRGWALVATSFTTWVGPTPMDAARAVSEVLSNPGNATARFGRFWSEAVSSLNKAPEMVWERRFKGGKITITQVAHNKEIWHLVADGGKLVREWVGAPGSQWIEIAANGDLLFSEEGRLYRWQMFPEDAPKLVADLSDMTFEEVAPPKWALEW